METPADNGPRRSLQFFDKTGTAVHKMFLRDHSDVAAFEALVAKYRADDQTPGEHVVAADAPKAETPDADIDAAAFQRDWLAMTDTHQFFDMLRRHGVSRAQALRLAPADHAQSIPASSVRTLLEDAAGTDLPIMVFVGNAGMIQIHTGPVKNIRVMGPWVNVLDPGFNLHLREDLVDTAWIVRKPTSDGIVSSLELLDASGMVIAMFFGERKPGQAEREDWRETLARVAAAGAAALRVNDDGARVANRFMADWQKARDEIVQRYGKQRRPRVLFILGHTGNQVMVAGQDTAADAMLAFAGADNALSGFTGYRPLTAEAAVAAQPDVLLTTTTGPSSVDPAATLLAQPGLANTPAGRAKRVVSFDALYLLGFGPRLPQAVAELAQRVHAA